MHTRSLLPLLALIVAGASIGDAAAGVVDPGLSTLPPCMALCPMGDMPFTVVTRDLANNPLAGIFVTLDFGACPGAFLCPSLPSDPYVVDPTFRTLRMTTGANGSVTFPARVGGTAPSGCVRVIA